MTVFEYAIYRAASLLMTEEERKHAEHLAHRGDAGEEAAAIALRSMSIEILHQHSLKAKAAPVATVRR